MQSTLLDKIIFEIIIFVLGSVFGVYLKTILDFKKEVLSKLWQQRFESYKIVWEITKILPRHPINKEILYSQLIETSIALKNWYFSGGGLLLSPRTQKSFRLLQEKLNSISEEQLNQRISVEKIEGKKLSDYEYFRSEFSAFRTNLTEDLSSRSYKLFLSDSNS